MKRLVLAAAVLGCASTPSQSPPRDAAVATVERADRSCASPFLTSCLEECTGPDFDACRSTCERDASVLCRAGR